MPDENLTAALQGTLDILNESPEAESPLAEATPDSIDLLFERINQNLAEGLPEKISDSDLLRVVQIYRAQALKWSQDEEIKRNKPRASKKPLGKLIDINLD